MKKFNANLGMGSLSSRACKILIKMKLTLFFLIACTMSLLADDTYSQVTKLNLHLQGVTIKEALTTIEDQSEFYFMYSGRVIDVDREVSVNIKNKKIDHVLEQLFAGTDVNYTISDRIIVLTTPEVFRSGSRIAFQQHSVTGTVTDANGTPLPGVNIVEVGTTNGAVTDLDGKYSISVKSENAVLSFSFIGYLTEEIEVGGQANIDVTLIEDIQALDEVVVVGYGTQKRADVTGAIATVKGEDLTVVPTSSVEQTLSGRAAGVQVTQGSGIPGAGASIRIRGVGTVNNAEPLYVIDGMILGNISAGGQTSISPLSMINPNDIESINILKDASATAIYGARAGNGVVIITTKKGTIGKTNISFHTYTSFSNLERDRVKMLSGSEWAGYFDKINQNSNRPEYNGKEFVQSIINGNDYETYDWYDEAIRRGTTENYELSLNSGTENSHYYASMNYFDQKGIMLNSDLERFNLRLNSDHKIGKKLKFGEVLTISRTSANTVGNLNPNSNTSNYLLRILQTNPYKKIYSEDGEYAGLSDFYVPELDHVNMHPIWSLKELHDQTDNTRILSSIYGEWKIIEGLNFKSTVSVDWLTAKNEYRQPNKNIEGTTTTDFDENWLTFRQSDNQTWYIENTLTYNKTIAEDHNITALAGYQMQYGLYRGFRAGDGYFADTDYWFFSRPSLMTEIKDSEGNVITTIPTKLPSVSNYESASAVESWFGRLNYSYKGRYLLTATLRYDGSSKFGSEKRWGAFPAVNAGWRISEEDFMAQVSTISNLKLRGGYGVSGSDNVPNYQYQSTVAGGGDYNYVFNEGIVEGFNLRRLANPFLQWETIKMSNIGVDLGLYNNRLRFTVDAFRKNTEKLFLSFAPPFEVGLEQNPSGNLGEVQNTGLEFGVGTDIFTGDFKWNADFNFSIVKNEVIALAADDADRFNGANITRVGEEIGALYGFVEEGIFQNWDEVYSHAYQNQAVSGTDENEKPVYDTDATDLVSSINFTAPGDIKYKDLNGDGIIDADNDRAIIGSTIPDFTWALNNDFGYKGFNLTVFMQGVHGVDIYNRLRAVQERPSGGNFNNKRATVLNAWDGKGSTNINPRQVIGDPNNNERISSHWIDNGSFVRLKSLRLAYTIPNRITNNLGITNTQLYVSSTNLMTFTKYKGYDPEVGLRSGGNPETAGTDNGVYPITRQFTLGLKVTF